MTLPKDVVEAVTRSRHDPSAKFSCVETDDVDTVVTYIHGQDAEIARLQGLHKSATRYAQRQQSRADKAESRLTAVLSEPTP